MGKDSATPAVRSGWHLDDKKHWRKFALWEESTRAPLILVAPPGAPGLRQGTVAGTRVDKPVSLLDIYPTLVDLCGLPPRDGLSGQSLVPLMNDPEATWTRPALTTHGRLNHAIRTDRWRYKRKQTPRSRRTDQDPAGGLSAR